MATLVLGTVGRIFGGPLGGLVGTVIGGAVDRAVLGGGKPREIGRIGNLAVQSAAYGEPIPFMAGRMRSAGNLIWSSGITETATGSGGGKRSGAATTSYSYSASFAVALAGREIAGVERIWADGKLIRDATGVFTTTIGMRLHRGTEDQDVDPLIAGAEGVSGTPAYRGIAYVVFEDMPLAEYGSRIPNLTFEIVADTGATDIVRMAIGQLGWVDGETIVDAAGDFPVIAGFHAGGAGTLADAVAPLVRMANATVADGAAGASTAGPALTIRTAAGVATAIAAADCDTVVPNDLRGRERRMRAGSDGLPTSMEIVFYDTSRDYQVGVQRVRRGGGGKVDQQSLAVAMAPQQAKSLAAMWLAGSRTARSTLSVRLPWRHLGIAVGNLVRLGPDPDSWRVRERRFEQFVVTLVLERFERPSALALAGDGGRALAFADLPAGPTHLELLDLPPLTGDLPLVPRLWLAGAGASPGWRRSPIEASPDGGALYAGIGAIERAVPQGVTLDALAAASAAAWDRGSTVEVALLSEAMWLESRSVDSVLAGANLALLGDELIQFASAEALPGGRFRLSGLLRGRRGTEAAIAGHAADDRFVLIDTGAMLPFDPPLEALGRHYRFRPAGAGDMATPFTAAVVGGRGLKPLSPAHLRLAASAGTVHASWIRRSRAGFGWSDFVDAPLAEATEAYRIEVTVDGRPARTVTSPTSSFTYTAAERAADGGGTIVGIAVAQLSESVGPGGFVAGFITLS